MIRRGQVSLRIELTTFGIESGDTPTIDVGQHTVTVKATESVPLMVGDKPVVTNAMDHFTIWTAECLVPKNLPVP